MVAVSKCQTAERDKNFRNFLKLKTFVLTQNFKLFLSFYLPRNLLIRLFISFLAMGSLFYERNLCKEINFEPNACFHVLPASCSPKQNVLSTLHCKKVVGWILDKIANDQIFALSRQAWLGDPPIKSFQVLPASCSPKQNVLGTQHCKQVLVGF